MNIGLRRRVLLVGVFVLLVFTSVLAVPVSGNGDPVPGGGGNPWFYLEVEDGAVFSWRGDEIGVAEFYEAGDLVFFVMTFPECYPDFVYFGVVFGECFFIWGSVHAEGSAVTVDGVLVLEGTWH